MSLLQALSTQAKKAYEQKNWKNACQYFDTYFKKSYPEDKPDKTMTLEDAIMLFKYANSLYEKIKSESNNKFSEEDIETIASYLLTSKQVFADAPKGSFPIEHYTDTFELLGQLALYNNQFKNAYNEFSNGYSLAVENKCGWRIRLSFIYNKVIALENQEKPRQAIEAVNEGLHLIEEELSANPDEVNAGLLNEFKASLTSKIDELKEDIKEQDENKDVIKEEEDHNDIEEEEEEEEEEAENAEKPDPAVEKPDSEAVTKQES